MRNGAHHPDDPSASSTAMSQEAAEAILRRHGLDAEGLASDELKRRWQALARRHHPDLGGDARPTQEINAAYSRLKRSSSGPVRVPPRSRATTLKRCASAAGRCGPGPGTPPPAPSRRR